MRFRFAHVLLFLFALLALCSSASAQLRISVGFGPPAIPVYEQPVCPGDGYIWTPGYWAWDDDAYDYYWVPGTWVLAPEVGYLWTPPYWGWADGAFVFYDGWWGPQVGFYGGINYGFGYFGLGFVGGRWQDGHFFYNREVMNVNVTEIHNVYNEHVTIVNQSHVSYNGGSGGLTARPTPQEEAAGREHHIGPIAAQTQHIQAARGNPELRASANHGRPSIAATARPGDFKGNVVAAREAGGTYNPPPNRGRAGEAPRPESGGKPAVHPSDLPPMEHPAAPSTGNTKLDRKYQQQQLKLQQHQQQERENLQKNQDQEHLQADQQHADDAARQQMEQRHQQQTQELQQRHTQQTQQLQQRQASHTARKR
jgi:hypothetical protein